MRWDHLGGSVVPTGQDTLPLALSGAVTRTFDTPDFRGITCYEIRAKSLLSRVPAASRMPFTWTVNPYRGCTHACVYCFARRTHTYLDLDAGHDFDSKIVVKVNAADLLRRELAQPGWRGEPIAMGTNVDCYQRVEGRYGLMRDIIGVLRERANPFSILTKSTLIARDLDLLRQTAEVTSVGVSFSVGFVDESLWRAVEPGTPSPARRLDAVRRFADAGFEVTVLMAPILPGLTDTEPHIDATVRAIAAAGAAGVVPLVLHLRPGAREWYAGWLSRTHPDLVDRYREIYSTGSGSYAPQAYQRIVAARVAAAARRHGLHRTPVSEHRRLSSPSAPPASPPRPARAPAQAEQLTLPLTLIPS